MKTIQQSIEKLMDDLQRERADIQVKLYLANEELEEEWDTLEKKMVQMEVKAENAKETALEPCDDVALEVKHMADDLMKGYKKVRKKL